MINPETDPDFAMELGLPGSALPWKQAANAFATEVQQARRSRQMSTGALAEQCEISVSFVHDIERAYPVQQSTVVSVCRNLGLPIPKLAGFPIHTFAMLIRQRREQARLPQYQLAILAGLAAKTLKDVERAARWPKPATCISLLSVVALLLEPHDIAAFVSDPLRAHHMAQSLRDSVAARLQASQDLRPRSSTRRRRAESPEDASTTNSTREKSKPPLLFTFRVYRDGSMTFVPTLKAHPE